MNSQSESKNKSKTSPALQKYIKITSGGESPVESESKTEAKDVLLSIPLIQKLEAISDAHNGIQSYQITNREDAREEAFNEIRNMGSYSGDDTYNGPVSKNKIVHFVLGRAACGKSSVLANPLSELFNAKLIDGDMVKTKLPGYNEGFGASFVHEESSEISKEIVKYERFNGSNLILPKVGDNANKMIQMMKDFKDNGYTVCVHYMELNQYKALSRNLQRYVDTGRYINADVMFSAISENDNDLISESFEKIIDSGYCDAWTRWNNDVPMGTKPYLVGYANNIVNEQLSAQYDNKIKNIIDGANTDPKTVIGRASETNDGWAWTNANRRLLASNIIVERIDVERAKIAESQKRIEELVILSGKQSVKIDETIDDLWDKKKDSKPSYEHEGSMENMLSTLESEGIINNNNGMITFIREGTDTISSGRNLGDD